MGVQFSPTLRRFVAAASTAGLAAATLVVVSLPAAADTAPSDTTLPTTVTSDALPTVQIDGIAWDQKISGNTVWVGGRFTTARPAGSAVGVNTVARTNMLAYNLTTGELITWFAPTFNGQVRQLAVSPDGSTVYAVGEFTQVNGETRYRAAAFSTSTGALLPWRPVINARVASVTATSTAVYLGGIFSTVGGQTRTRIAAVNTTTGAVLGSIGSADNGQVTALVASPDGSSLIVGGSFTTYNGSGDPGYGLARVDLATGTATVLPANSLIRNAGENSSITSLTADSDYFYGSGYHFGSGGNLEGTFAARWTDGSIVWVEDCHGDTYQSFPIGDVIYSASHKHYCGNIGGFPQTEPWSVYRATAITKAVRGTVTADPYGYYNFAGNPAPELLNWFPTLDTGTVSGAGQGPWAVTGNAQYVVMGGEFQHVNGKLQQGLVRFAVSAIAPDTDGPRLAGAAFNPTLLSVRPGQVRITWPGNYDRDNKTLTYKVYRQTTTSTPIFTDTVTAAFWQVQPGTFVDTGLTPGSTVRYRVTATDPMGNVAQSEWVTVTVAGEGVLSAYGAAVLDDEPTDYWRLGEATGTTAANWAGIDDLTIGSGVTLGASGAALGDSNTAGTFSGNSDASGLASTTRAVTGPQVFSVETWFRTTSTSGGKIVGFGNASSGYSSNYDRHIYMTPSGKVVFGVYPGTSRTVTSSASYNDGEWHQAVATLGPAGQVLYVDGKLVARRSDTTSAQEYSGYWRVGGDSSWEGDAFFNGSIDEVSVYPTVLTAQQVDDHWVASGRTTTQVTPPSDAYGAAVFDAAPDLYWRLGEASGSTAADSGPLGNNGSYQGNVTLGVSGPTGLTGTAAGLVPESAVVGTSEVSNPLNFSEEVWFSTTSTSGGRIMGFGNASSGLSSSYDRHIYLESDGRLTFGVWTGWMNTITTSAAYNDGAWHHVVATQSTTDGLRLYVDGALQGTNSQTSAQDYSGYWRVGGDNQWGPNPWFTGSLDEAAVYSVVLSPAQVAQHYALGSGTPTPNNPPVAEFTPTAAGLGVSVDGSASSDSDGTIAAYAWTFGDGSTGTGPTASHTYATAGTYSVVLTVTDDDGASASVSHDVTVQPANVLPVADFGYTLSGRTVSVDGTTSSDPDGTVTGYAWTFGDGATGSGSTAAHTYATAGTYTVSLTVTDDDGATATVSHDVTVAPDNVVPTAAFTTTTAGLAATVNASSSNDPDGSLVDYLWDFGDGTVGNGVTVTRTYTAAGTYHVTLTVRDDDGATASVTHDVTVAAANVAPAAAFTPTATDLTVAVDGSASSDPDGTISSYAWTFGDGSTGTGVTASHTYAAAGTYTVALTVTDNGGLTAMLSHAVTVAAPAGVLASDAFGRSASSGWGTADVGGAWSTSGTASRFSVSGGVGTLNLAAAGATLQASLGSVSSSSTEVQVVTSLSKVSTASSYVSVVGRTVGSSDYRARLRFYSSGAVVLQAMRGTSTALAATTVSGLTYAAGDRLQVRLQVTGTSPTVIRAKVWKAGAAEPSAWQVSTTDATAGLQAAGGVGLGAQLASTATEAPVLATFDDLWVGAPDGHGVPANVPPVAAFTQSVSGLTGSFNASTSSDADGTIASYAWAFGDGSTGSGATASHTYAAAGTYTVTLTVTDNVGATDTETATVVATAVTPGVLAADAFGRTVASGWGSADTGGAWTVSPAARGSVSSGTGKLVMTAAGSLVTANLTGVSSTATDLRLVAALDKAPTGGATDVTIVGRGVGTSAGYRVQLKVATNGSVRATAQAVSGTTTSLQAVTVAGLTYAAGDQLNVRVAVTGTSPTRVQAKVWKVGTTEPTAWQVDVTDSTAALQVGGGVGIMGYISGSATNAPVTLTVDDLTASAA